MAYTHLAVWCTRAHIQLYALHTLISRFSIAYTHSALDYLWFTNTARVIYVHVNILIPRSSITLAHSNYSIPRITCTHETEQFWHTQSTAFQELPVRTRLSNSGTLKVQHSKNYLYARDWAILAHSKYSIPRLPVRTRLSNSGTFKVQHSKNYLKTQDWAILAHSNYSIPRITCRHETEQYWHTQSTAFQELPVSKDWATLAHSNYSIPRITCKHETEQFRHTQITEFQKLPVRTRLSNSGTLKIQHSKNYLYARDWAAAMFFWCSVSELLQYMPIRMNSISCSVLQAKVWEDRQRASPGS